MQATPRLLSAQSGDGLASPVKLHVSGVPRPSRPSTTAFPPQLASATQHPVLSSPKARFPAAWPLAQRHRSHGLTPQAKGVPELDVFVALPSLSRRVPAEHDGDWAFAWVLGPHVEHLGEEPGGSELGAELG